MKKIFIILLVLIALPLVIPAPGQAIPAFARKYGFNCMMCHTAYPKLNDWGQRYRDNGYQLPGQEGKEKTVFDSPHADRAPDVDRLQRLQREAERGRELPDDGRLRAQGARPSRGGRPAQERLRARHLHAAHRRAVRRLHGHGRVAARRARVGEHRLQQHHPERPERAGRTLRAGVSSLQLEALLLPPVAVRRLRVPDGRQRLPLRRQPDRRRGDGAFQTWDSSTASAS